MAGKSGKVGKMTSYAWWKSPKYSGVVIFDADGWDRSSFEAFKKDFYETPVTEEEFARRLNLSTIMGSTPGL